MIKETIDINKAARKALELEVENIRNAPEDTDLANYNPCLRSSKKVSSDLFLSVGQLSMKGVLWYKIKCTLAVTGYKTGAVKFKGKGFGFDIGAFTSEVAGTFIVDPATMKEECYFTLGAVDVAEGIVTFAIFRKKFGELCGVFAGLTEGLEVGVVAGKGNITTIGF
jgi:hypothetical protein